MIRLALILCKNNAFKRNLLSLEATRNNCYLYWAQLEIGCLYIDLCTLYSYHHGAISCCNYVYISLYLMELKLNFMEYKIISKIVK